MEEAIGASGGLAKFRYAMNPAFSPLRENGYRVTRGTLPRLDDSYAT